MKTTFSWGEPIYETIITSMKQLNEEKYAVFCKMEKAVAEENLTSAIKLLGTDKKLLAKVKAFGKETFKSLEEIGQLEWAAPKPIVWKKEWDYKETE